MKYIQMISEFTGIKRREWFFGSDGIRFLSYCCVGSKGMSLIWPIKSSEEHLFCPAHDLTSDTNLQQSGRKLHQEISQPLLSLEARTATVLTIKWCKMASGFISPVAHRGWLP